jgi:hypothetical protein
MVVIMEPGTEEETKLLSKIFNTPTCSVNYFPIPI